VYVSVLRLVVFVLIESAGEVNHYSPHSKSPFLIT